MRSYTLFLASALMALSTAAPAPLPAENGGISGLLGNTVGTAGGLLDGTAGIAGNSLNLVTGGLKAANIGA